MEKIYDALEKISRSEENFERTATSIIQNYLAVKKYEESHEFISLIEKKLGRQYTRFVNHVDIFQKHFVLFCKIQLKRMIYIFYYYPEINKTREK